MSFSNRLKERRKELGITQVELARLLGVTKGAVGNYEAGFSSPKSEILYKVFNVLKCDANFLFQDEMNSIKEKAPETGEPVSETTMKHAMKLYDALLSSGLLKSGQDLTTEQLDALDGLAAVISALFHDPTQ